MNGLGFEVLRFHLLDGNFSEEVLFDDVTGTCLALAAAVVVAHELGFVSTRWVGTVSYTHLTLPTICSV